MSLEQHIQNLTAAITKLTSLMEDGVIPNFAKSKQSSGNADTLGTQVATAAGDADAAEPAKERKKPGPKPKPKAVEQTAPESNATQQNKQFEEIVDLIKTHVGGNASLIENTLADHGVKRASELKPDQYGAFLEAFKNSLPAPANEIIEEESFV